MADYNLQFRHKQYTMTVHASRVTSKTYASMTESSPKTYTSMTDLTPLIFLQAYASMTIHAPQLSPTQFSLHPCIHSTSYTFGTNRS